MKIQYKSHVTVPARVYSHAELRINELENLFKGTPEANVVFAAAPSQNETLAHLLKQDIDWTKVRGFHQDEYIGLDPAHSAGFGNFMRRTIFDLVPFKELHYLLCKPEEAEAKCASYSELLKKYPADLIFLGFGENGHMAFNDPAVADFNDPKMVKIVELDDICRQQQVNDGCFQSIDQVPTHALTLTIPTLYNVENVFCVVPAASKAEAVKNTVYGQISEDCPASILRKHPNAILYCDSDSGIHLKED